MPSPEEREPSRPSWASTVSDAVDQMEESDAEMARARERRKRGSAGLYLALALPVFLAVVGWNVWLATRPPVLPDDEAIAAALRRSAGALAGEVVAFRDANGRLPTALEMAGLTDDELRYAVAGEGFVVTNTDGVVTVRFDGTVPLNRWIAEGGYAVTGDRP